MMAGFQMLANHFEETLTPFFSYSPKGLTHLQLTTFLKNSHLVSNWLATPLQNDPKQPEIEKCCHSAEGKEKARNAVISTFRAYSELHVLRNRYVTSTGDRGRTDTLLLEPDFESGASANSATPA